MPHPKHDCGLPIVDTAKVQVTKDMLNPQSDLNSSTATAERTGPADVPTADHKSFEQHRLQNLLMLYRPTEADGVEPESRRAAEDNQRQFSRCRISHQQMMGTLNVNGARYHCCLTEMSIGGFGVIVAGHRRFITGTICSLRTADMNYVVRISRLEERPDGIYIGLKQLEEVLDRQVRLPGEPSTAMGYLLAALSGGLVALLAYFISTGM